MHARSASGLAKIPRDMRLLLLLVLIVLQIATEVLPSFTDVPWSQPQAMKYGGFVFIAAVLSVFLVRRR